MMDKKTPSAAVLLAWCVEHDGECLGDHPQILEKAKAALAIAALSMPPRMEGRDMDAPEQPCGGCGKPLLIENAWMEDGCPCNTPAGVNNLNLYRWRLLHELQQQQNRVVPALRQWKCPACGGAGTYLNRSATPPHEETVQCKKCDGDGLHPTASAALKREGLGTQADSAGAVPAPSAPSSTGESNWYGLASTLMHVINQHQNSPDSIALIWKIEAALNKALPSATRFGETSGDLKEYGALAWNDAIDEAIKAADIIIDRDFDGLRIVMRETLTKLRRADRTIP